MEKSAAGILHGRSISGFVFFVMFVAYALCYINFASIPSPYLSNNSGNERVHKGTISSSKCEGKYIYVHDLPSEFNKGLVENCRFLSSWVDFCLYLSNGGFGPRVNGSDRSTKKGVFPRGRRSKGWYKTNQFSLEVIFHARMKRYECLTPDPSRAAAVFVPYYAGLDVGRHLWDGFSAAARDATAERLDAWLRRRPEWERASGRDHFFVGGRVAWDFRRPDADGAWGSRLMLLPGPANMTMLTIEAAAGAPGGNEFAVPYPTYFHPSSARQVAEWQRRVRRLPRPRLFSFVGAPRPGSSNSSIRGEIIRQCESESSLLRCDAAGTDCEDPRTVMAELSRSVFCLQPPGDSYTRRSAFDSVLAGCVPVFFHLGSAYEQYRWHFPADPEKYSVYIPEAGVREGRVSIGEVLRRIPEGSVSAMREEVIRMIPRVVYADPTAREKGFQDAFDIAVNNVLERVQRVRKEMEDDNEIS